MMRHRLVRRRIQRANALVGYRRSARSDLSLATILAAVAGAANAGGFFAVGRYTSHMTGYLSELADNISILNVWIAFVCLLVIGAFMTGAGVTAMLIGWARLRMTRQQYALPLALQGVFLLCFASGGLFTGDWWRLWSLCCLSFIMGMQNATITEVSGARIRTTHATGMITDLGIEAGRAVFGLIRPTSAIRARRRTVGILGRLVLAFFIGGVVGAIGYGQVGFMFSLPLGAVLLALSLPSLIGRRR